MMFTACRLAVQIASQSHIAIEALGLRAHGGLMVGADTAIVFWLSVFDACVFPATLSLVCVWGPARPESLGSHSRPSDTAPKLSKPI